MPLPATKLREGLEMTTLTLDELQRECVSPLTMERKWVFERGDWIQIDVIRVRRGRGWVELRGEQEKTK